MRLTVFHETHYSYDNSPSYLVQRLHLKPADHQGQRTLSWTIGAPGIDNAVVYVDGFGNWVHLVTAGPLSDDLVISAAGEIETTDTTGIIRGLSSVAPDNVFLRQTTATEADASMSLLAKSLAAQAAPLDRAHALMSHIHENMEYVVGASDVHTSAAEALADGRGVCQDHAHVMVGIAREMGIPSRYATGYLVTGVGASSAAAHAWAELLIPEIGWIGFDPANCQCPTDHYVRIAAGLDAAAVAPVRGSRRGGSTLENMRVEVRVEIAQQ